MASGSECQLLAGFLSEWILQDTCQFVHYEGSHANCRLNKHLL